LTGLDPLTADTSAALSVPRHHLPCAEDFLYLPPWVQPYAYRIVDKLFAHSVWIHPAKQDNFAK
jgi:hypothetical protein